MTASQEFDEEHLSRLGKNHAWSANVHNTQINPQKITPSEMIRFIRNEWSPGLLINYTLNWESWYSKKVKTHSTTKQKDKPTLPFTVNFVGLPIMKSHCWWHGRVGVHAWNGGSMSENETGQSDCRHQNWKEVHQQDNEVLIYIYALPKNFIRQYQNCFHKSSHFYFTFDLFLHWNINAYQ